MNWGVWDKNLSTTEMVHLINLCIENKITTFDHADIYGGYTTEGQFGKAFSEGKISREKIQLISKCGIQAVAENRSTRLKHYDYSKEHIIWSVENSLKNLQTDYLDVLLLHRPSPLMVADEIAEAVEKLKSEGKIIDFGVSNFSSSQTDLIRSKTEVSYNQIQFSATHHEAMLDGSDAVADWPVLNALVNTAGGASWVSLHHGGGVGMGYSIHSGMVIVADGTADAAARLSRVLRNDPGIGVIRHADAGYELAQETAKEYHLDIRERLGV